MLLLNPSANQSPDGEFVRTCEALMSAQSRTGEERNLHQVVARLCSPFQAYLRDVKDAESWLDRNGFLKSLDYYVNNGGRELVLFHELNRVSEPQYGICRKSLAYLSYALRARYSKGGVRRLYTMFPGPSEGLGPNGFYRYFEHYDLLSNEKRPRTFGEVFGKNVDPLLRNKTMLHHGSNGVFDSVALSYDSGNSFSSSLNDIGAISYLKWFKESVDNKAFVYQSERAGAGKCEIQKGTPQWEEYVAGRGFVPYKRSCSYYYLHTVA